MQTKRILIIDDNVDHVSALAELLRLSGHRVEVATNPLYAMDLARRFQPQFAFIDIGLPYMDGYKAAQRLKRAQQRCQPLRDLKREKWFCPVL